MKTNNGTPLLLLCLGFFFSSCVKDEINELEGLWAVSDYKVVIDGLTVPKNNLTDNSFIEEKNLTIRFNHDGTAILDGNSEMEYTYSTNGDEVVLTRIAYGSSHTLSFHKLDGHLITNHSFSIVYDSGTEPEVRAEMYLIYEKK